jgi:hypothetical protein
MRDLSVQPAKYEDRVNAELISIRSRHDAKELFRLEQQSGNSGTRLKLRTYAELEDQPELYRIDGLMPLTGNVVFSGFAKAGKTTTFQNLERSLITGEDFLGYFPCQKIAGRVVRLDFEMPEGMLRHYASEAGIDLTSDRIRVEPLKGKAAHFGILSPDIRRDIGNQLREVSTEVLILDPIAGLAKALGLDLDNNDDARTLTTALDELQYEAGIDCIVLGHHTGHADKGRSRGASTLMDWPDAIWNVEKDPRGVRTFSAEGRMISAHGTIEKPSGSAVLSFRSSSESDSDLPLITAILSERGSMNKGALWKEYRSRGGKHNEKYFTDNVEEYASSGTLNVTAGAGNAKVVALTF